MTETTLGALAEHLGAVLKGDPTHVVRGLATLQAAGPGDVSFLSRSHYRPLLETTQASAVIVSEADSKACAKSCLVVDNPYWAYAKAAQYFDPVQQPEPAIHPSALIDATACIDATASIGPNCVIGRNVKIGAGVVLRAQVHVGDDTVIGAHTRIEPQVVLYHAITLGAHCLIHAGAVIGADGFGFAPAPDGSYEKISQLAGVVLEDHVEIGANTTIDRGALSDTVIKRGAKLDNQIQIGHGAVIGEHTVMAGCTAVAGSTTIGAHCQIGGGSNIAGHLTVADKTVITGMSGVASSLETPGAYASVIPVQPAKAWFKNVARLQHLNDWIKRLIRLEKKLDEERT